MPRGFYGLGGTRSAAPRQGAYGYSDTYGARVLPGGYLAASPDAAGRPRRLYGVDFPVVGYTNTGWDVNNPLTGDYADTLGIAPVGPKVDVGGAGTDFTAGGLYGPGGSALFGGNMPPWENRLQGPNAGSYRPWSDWLSNATNTDGNGNRIPTGSGFPDLSSLPPVNAATGYPIPGYGSPANAAGNWQANARSSGGGGFGGAGPSKMFEPRGFFGTVRGDIPESLFTGAGYGQNSLPGGMPRGYIL